MTRLGLGTGLVVASCLFALGSTLEWLGPLSLIARWGATVGTYLCLVYGFLLLFDNTGPKV
jgi:hypothetical protein